MSQELNDKSKNDKYGLGTLVNSPITTHDFLDVFPTAISNEIRGGLHVVEKVSDLDTYYNKYSHLIDAKIDDNDLTPQRLTIGTLVFCMENKTLYYTDAQNNILDEEAIRRDRIVVSFEEFKRNIVGDSAFNGFRNYYYGKLNQVYIPVDIPDGTTNFKPDYYQASKMIADVSELFHDLIEVTEEDFINDLIDYLNRCEDCIVSITKRYPFLSFEEAEDTMTKKFYLYLLTISRMIKGFFSEEILIRTNTQIFCNKKEIGCELDPFKCCQKCKGCIYKGLINPKFVPILKVENGRVSILNYYNLKFDERLQRIISIVPGDKRPEYNDSLATMGDVKSLIRDKIRREDGDPRYSFYDLDFDDENLLHNPDGSLMRNPDGSFLDLDGNPINPSIPASVNFFKFNGLPASAYAKKNHEHPELVSDYELEIYKAQVNGKYQNLLDRDDIFARQLNRISENLAKLNVFIGVSSNKKNKLIINSKTESSTFADWNHEDRIITCELKIDGINNDIANITDQLSKFGAIIANNEKMVNKHEKEIQDNKKEIQRLRTFTGIVESNNEEVNDNATLEDLKKNNHEDRILALEAKIDELIKLTKPMIGQLKMYGRQKLVEIDIEDEKFDGWTYPDGTILDKRIWPDAFEVFGTDYNTGGEDGNSFRIPNLQSFIKINNGNKFRDDPSIRERMRNTQDFVGQKDILPDGREVDASLGNGANKKVKWYGCVMSHTHTFTGDPIIIRTKTHKHTFVGTSSTQTVSASHKHKFGDILFGILQQFASHSHEININSSIASEIKVILTSGVSSNAYRKDGLICIHAGKNSTVLETVPLTTSAATETKANTEAYNIDFSQISTNSETGIASSNVTLTITPSGEVKETNIDFHNNQQDDDVYTKGSTEFIPKGKVSTEGEDERKESYPTHNWVPTLIYIGKKRARNRFIIFFSSNQGDESLYYKQGINIAENDTTGSYPTPLRGNPFQRAGFKYLGWSKTSDGEVEINNKQSVSWKNFFEHYEDALPIISPTGERTERVVNLFAVWEGYLYNVRFNSNDNTERSYMQNNVRFGKKFNLALNEFARTGYRFNGWAENPYGEPIYTDGQEVSNLTVEENGIFDLYAKWKENEYTVVFNSNGGTGNMTPQKFIYDIGKTLNVCTFVKKGYHFIGWALDSNPESPVSFNDGTEVKNLTDVPNGSVTLFAKWEENRYTIAFQSNGGDGIMNDIELNYTQVTHLPPNTFTKRGYTFDGWSITPDSEPKYVDGQEVVSLTDYQEIVSLYAHWKAIGYKVKLDANGGEGEQIPIMDVEFDEEKALSLNTYTRRGFTWKGWSTSPTGSKIYNDGDTIKNLSEREGNIVVLYAVWQANPYILTYANFGDGEREPIVVYHQDEVIVDNPSTKTGYIFQNWLTSDLPKETYDPGEIFTMPYNDVLLSGNWEPITYIIKYNPTEGAKIDDEGTRMEDSVLDYDMLFNLSKNLYIKKGYIFRGWSRTNGGEKVFDDKQLISNLTTINNDEINLYTVWEADKYVITFDKGNDKATGSMPDMTFTQDETQTISKNKFKLTGYHFLKWEVKDWTSEVSSSQYYEDESEARFNQPAELKAIWERNVYTVKFDLRGMKNVVESAPVDITATYDETIINLPLLTTLDPETNEPTHYLQGWTRKIASTVKEDGFDPNTSHKNLATEGVVTLYAVWKPVQKTVTFHSNEGILKS